MTNEYTPSGRLNKLLFCGLGDLDMSWLPYYPYTFCRAIMNWAEYELLHSSVESGKTETSYAWVNRVMTQILIVLLWNNSITMIVLHVFQIHASCLIYSSMGVRSFTVLPYPCLYFFSLHACLSVLFPSSSHQHWLLTWSLKDRKKNSHVYSQFNLS